MMSAANKSEFDAPNVAHCPQCAALLPVDAITCWLCFAPVEHQTLQRRLAGKSAMAHEPTGGFSLASLMMFVTLAAVVMGVSSIAPGVGIPLGIVLLVVWLRTAAVAKYRRAYGQVVSREDKLHLFLASFGATVALLAVTCIAGCGAFIAACFACVGTWAALGGDRTTGAGWVVAWIVFGAVILVIAVPVLRVLYKIVRRRWRRDVGEPRE